MCLSGKADRGLRWVPGLAGAHHKNEALLSTAGRQLDLRYIQQADILLHFKQEIASLREEPGHCSPVARAQSVMFVLGQLGCILLLVCLRVMILLSSTNTMSSFKIEEIKQIVHAKPSPCTT